MAGRLRPPLLLVALLLGAVLLGGCGAERRPEEVVVDTVELEGVTRFEKGVLLAHTYATEHSIWPWGDDGRYSPALARLDAPLVRDLYHAHGYHRVEVAPIELDATDPEKARLLIKVVEGPPTTVAAVAFEWPEGRPDFGDEVEALSAVKPGAAFEVGAFTGAAGTMRAALQARGHALAAVEKRAEVDRKAGQAHVGYVLRPGPPCRFGEIRFAGLKGAPADLLAREIRFAEGAPVTPATLQRMEKSIYALDLFRSVVAVPAEAPAADGTLDVTVHVDELPPESIQLGVGVGFEPTRWVQRGIVRYGHDNLFGRLVRFDVRLTAGWAELPTPWAPDAHGPVAELAPRLRLKGLLEDELVWSVTPAIELGIEEGYRFYTPSGRVGVSRFLFGRTLAELAYEVSFFDFFDIARGLDDGSTDLGFDFRDPYLLSFVELRYTVALTDEFFHPSSGVSLEMAYALAGGAFGGDFDFQRVGPAVRAWWPFAKRLQLAARAETGLILPYGDRPGAPISLKYALGGADTVRGWGLKRLSPQLRTGDDGDGRGIPVGGNTMVLGNLELRWNVWGDLSVALFGDVGDVQPDELTWRPGDWQYATGLGARYKSPIGVARLDLGFRVNDDPERFRDEPIWALHFALGEPF